MAGSQSSGLSSRWPSSDLARLVGCDRLFCDTTHIHQATPRHAQRPPELLCFPASLSASVLSPAQSKLTGWQTGDVWCGVLHMRAHSTAKCAGLRAMDRQTDRQTDNQTAQHSTGTNPGRKLCVNAQFNSEAAHIGIPAHHRPPKYEIETFVGPPSPPGSSGARPRNGFVHTYETTRHETCQPETVALLENRRTPCCCNQKKGSAARCAVSIQPAPPPVLHTTYYLGTLFTGHESVSSSGATTTRTGERALPS